MTTMTAMIMLPPRSMDDWWRYGWHLSKFSSSQEGWAPKEMMFALFDKRNDVPFIPHHLHHQALHHHIIIIQGPRGLKSQTLSTAAIFLFFSSFFSLTRRPENTFHFQIRHLTSYSLLSNSETFPKFDFQCFQETWTSIGLFWILRKLPLREKFLKDSISVGNMETECVKRYWVKNAYQHWVVFGRYIVTSPLRLKLYLVDFFWSWNNLAFPKVRLETN